MELALTTLLENLRVLLPFLLGFGFAVLLLRFWKRGEVGSVETPTTKQKPRSSDTAGSETAAAPGAKTAAPESTKSEPEDKSPESAPAGVSSEAGGSSDTSDSASDPEEEDAENPEAALARSVSARVYKLAEGMESFFSRSAHPRDLLDHPDFHRGVELMSELSKSELIGYYTGDHALISCLSLGAMALREEVGEWTEMICEGLSDTGSWSLYFALRLLNARSTGPVVGEALMKGQEWWVNDQIALGSLREFLQIQSYKKEKPAFGPALEKLPSERVDAIEKLLAKVKEPYLDDLRAEFETWKKTRIDREFLRTIGRFRTGDGDEKEIYVHPKMESDLKKIEACLLENPVRSVLLVGESGAGKSALISALIRKRRNSGWTFLEASASDVLAGQVYIGELEKRIQQMIEQLGSERRVVWIVPAFHELLYAGRHRYNPIGILDNLLPHIESGKLIIIGEVLPDAYENILTESPQVRTILDAIRLEALDESETIDLARRWARREGVRDENPGRKTGEPIVDERTLQEAWRLTTQYFAKQAAPGNLLDFLENTRAGLKQSGRGEGPIELEDLLESLSNLTGLPASILDEREALDLNKLRALFHERVIGQSEAVNCLVDRVAMIKAGFTDPTRPLGVFLFVGPTGTGKTEIAKTLAEFLFGAGERMIRLDMSEFQTAESLSRILGDMDQGGGALVNMIRKQPFSVVLLDEFEKAHSNIWDLFLQVFDDGRLTDRRGNLADFRNSIIILTSNLGATIQRTGIGFGSQGGEFSAGGVEKMVQDTFRSEFINRLDRVVVFRPLSRSVMREILQKELEKVLGRRGFRNREWAVEWDDSAMEFLLDRGFTVDLGARPLGRAIERYLLAPLAFTIVNRRFPEGDQFLFVRSGEQGLVVEFVDPDAEEDIRAAPALAAPAQVGTSGAGGANGAKLTVSEGEEIRLEGIILTPRGVLDEGRFLKHRYESIRKHLETEKWQTEKNDIFAATSNPDFWESEGRFKALGRVEYMERIEKGLETADFLMGRLGLDRERPAGSGGLSSSLTARLAQQLYLLETALRGFEQKLPSDTFIRVEGDVGDAGPISERFARKLAEMYRGWAEKRRMRFLILEEKHGQPGEPFTFLMAVSGFGAYYILRPEEGHHILEQPGEIFADSGRNERSFRRCKVTVRVGPQPDLPHKDKTDLIKEANRIFDEEPEKNLDVVRRYREEPAPLVRDRVRGWRTGLIQRVLAGDFDLIT